MKTNNIQTVIPYRYTRENLYVEEIVTKILNELTSSKFYYNKYNRFISTRVITILEEIEKEIDNDYKRYNIIRNWNNFKYYDYILMNAITLQNNKKNTKI